MKIEDYIKLRNYWWDTKEIKEIDRGIPRNEYVENALKKTKYERIICLTGVRRSGKTTIMHQIMHKLLKKGLEPRRIVYVKIDEVDIKNLREILSTYNELTGFPPDKEEAYFFLDEVQYLKNWQTQIKGFIDAHYKSKFIISGSSRTLLYRNGAESLMGRITFLNIFPLTFSEFLEFNKISIRFKDFEEQNLDNLKKLQFQLMKEESKIKYHLNQYLDIGGYPEWFKIKDLSEWRKILSNDYLPLIIFKDIVEIFKPKNPLVLERLAKEIAFFSTQRFSYSKLSNRLDLDRESIKLYIYYLKTSMLVFLLEVYTRSGKSSERAEKKLLFWEEGMRRSIISKVEDSISIENIVIWHLIKQNMEKTHIFYEPKYYKEIEEIDFIYQTKNDVIPIEIKYRNQITKKDLKGMYKFIEKFKLKKAIVITKDLLKEEDNILYIPAWLFLLHF